MISVALHDILFYIPFMTPGNFMKKEKLSCQYVYSLNSHEYCAIPPKHTHCSEVVRRRDASRHHGATAWSWQYHIIVYV